LLVITERCPDVRSQLPACSRSPCRFWSVGSPRLVIGARPSSACNRRTRVTRARRCRFTRSACCGLPRSSIERVSRSHRSQECRSRAGEPNSSSGSNRSRAIEGRRLCEGRAHRAHARRVAARNHVGRGSRSDAVRAAGEACYFGHELGGNHRLLEMLLEAGPHHLLPVLVRCIRADRERR
jgi:hypothetical protein